MEILPGAGSSQTPFGGSPVHGKKPSILELRVSDVWDKFLSRSSRSSPDSATASHGSGRSSFESASPIQLDHFALVNDGGLGYGYKSANLIFLSDLAIRVGAEVPSFMPLGHQEMVDHIVGRGGYPDLFSDYGAFVDALGNPPILTVEARSILTRIRANIEVAFSEERLFQTPEILDWLKSQSSEFIAVRSTGKEDSDKISNAGGNFSNPFVSRNVPDISKNIGAVIASYFSKNSISQRISSDDATLVLEREPFVPVLLQVAAAEPIRGLTDERMVPRSGVLFVKEDISEASIGLGHNEGVVTSEVVTDTYRFSSGGGIQKTIKKKPDRFRGRLESDGKVSCKRTKCRGALATCPALTPELAKRLQRIADEIYIVYENPMDVEFTIIGDKIFLLQVRPLIIPESLPTSYLVRAEEGIECEALTNGGSFVREIDRSQNIIVCDTIREAYDSYKLLLKDDRNLIKGIIIKQGAPRSSHEAVFFTSRGLPIMVTPVMNLTPPYLLDPQQGLIAKTGEIAQGNICYPIPLQYSMSASPLVELMHIGENREEIRRGLSLLSERMGPLLGPETAFSQLKSALEGLKSEDTENRKIAFSQIIHFIHKQSLMRDITPKSRIELIMILENIIDIRDSHLDANPLYVARIVEACLFQTGDGIIGGFSLARSIQDTQSHKAGSRLLERPQTEDTLKDILFIKMGRTFLREELKLPWSAIIRRLPEISTEKKNIVKSLFHLVESMGSGTELVNVTIANLLEKHGMNAPAFFDELAQVAEDLKPVLVKAHIMYAFVINTRVNLGAFSNSEHIRKSLPKLQEKLRDIGFCKGEGSIIHTFRTASPAAKLILIQTIREVVTAYDEVIKSCTGSTEYSSHVEQAKDLLSLLKPYREMMEVIEKLANIEHSESYDEASYALPDSLDRVSEDAAEELKGISPGFDVTQILASNHIIYTESPPVPAITLEEKFTLFHKTMEASLSRLATECGYSVVILPEELQTYMRELLTGRYLQAKQLESINIHDNTIVVKFMVPLRDHGASLILSYDKKNRSIGMELSIYGGNEWNRWGDIKERIETCSDKIGLDILPIKKSETGISIKIGKDALTGNFDSQFLSVFLNGIINNSFELNDTFLILLAEKFQTHELCMQEVVTNSGNLQYVAMGLRTPDLCQVAFDRNVYAFQFVPHLSQTEEMVLQAVREDGTLLKFVNPSIVNEEIISVALTQNNKAFPYVPKPLQTLEMVHSLLQRNGLVLEYVRSDLLSQRTVNLAFENDEEAFRYIPLLFQTPEMALMAVQDNGKLLEYVRPDLVTREVILAALNQNPRSLQYVPEINQTAIMVLGVVTNNWEALEFVREDLISRDVIQAALSQDEGAIEYIPIELQTSAMIARAVEASSYPRWMLAVGGVFKRCLRGRRQ